jgi:exonuclease VII large subunit
MDTRANVVSLESIEEVRSALVSFADRVTDALAELESEMRRVLEWLEHDRPAYWKHQVRLSNDQVHEAQQALHRCLMFPVADERPACYEERAALKRAQAKLAYCEEKVQRVRHWQQTVERELFEYQGRISQLVRLVEVEVPGAIGVLTRIIRYLEEYQAIRTVSPHTSYNDVAVANELMPEDETGAASDEIGGDAGGGRTAAKSKTSEREL